MGRNPTAGRNLTLRRRVLFDAAARSAGGDLVGLEDLTFQKLLGYAFAPVTFALCGFANFGSFAILLGGLAQIAPKRRGSVARLGVRAVLAGTLANLLNAAVAGMFV